MKIRKILGLLALFPLVTLPSGFAQNIVANPSGNQTIVQPGTLAQNNATTLSVNRFENIRYADQFPTLQRAINDTPPGGTLVVPPGYSTTLPDSDGNCVNIGASIVLRFAGSAIIHQGSCQITVQGGTNSVSIVSDSVGLTNGAGGSPVQFLGYSGAGAAVQIGSSSSDTTNFYLRGIYVELLNASSFAVGVSMTRVHQFVLDSLEIGAGSTTATNLVGILLNGTGDSSHDLFTGIGEINMPIISIGANSNFSTGIRATNEVTDTLVVGGHIGLDGRTVNMQYPNGTTCFDIDGTSGPTAELFLYSPNCDSAVTAIGTEGNGHAVGDVRIDSHVTGKLANFATGTNASKIRFVNATSGSVSDSGIGNSVEFPYLDQVHNDLWQIVANSSGWAVNNFLTHATRIYFTPSNTFITGEGGGGVLFNTGSGNGVQFFNGAGTQVASIDKAGNAQFNGNLTVNGVKAFKIDHPLDPANKYLFHSAIESSDMKNMYDGIVVLDEKGEAEVKLPEWFQALNKDFRYQLTCIGGSAPVYIAQEIQNNQFRVAGGRPGLRVSWQVTGIRHDASADANRFAIEQEKPVEERGHYLFAGFDKTNKGNQQSSQKQSSQK